VHVDDVVVAEPRRPADTIEQLLAAQRHPVVLRQRVEQLVLDAGQLELDAVQRDAARAGSSSSRPRRRTQLPTAAGGDADRGRRISAPTRAISSRGKNGLIMLVVGTHR
jgi:hypothetical protein